MLSSFAPSSGAMSRSDFSAAVAAILAEGGLDIVRALGISSDASAVTQSWHASSEMPRRS